MNRYAGEEAVVEQLRGVDDQGCRLAMLRHNGTPLAAFAFRTRDLEYIGPAPTPSASSFAGSESLAGDSRIVVGAKVIIHKHRPVGGETNWSSSMDEYTGKTATIVSLLGKDRAGCMVARVSINSSTVSSYAFRVRDLEFVSGASTASTLSTDLDGDSRIVDGAKVIIHKHRPVNGGSNWVSSMDQYVGKEATVVRISGRDGQDCRMAQVKVGDSVVTQYKFRVRDLEFVSAGTPLSSDLAGDSRVVAGAKVIIHKHRDVGGKTNWVSGMDKYVGKDATVVSLLGKDQAGCEVARVSVDGTTVTAFSFRVRDLEFVSGPSSSMSSDLDGDARIVAGSKVIIHRHRPVNGQTNWVSSMDKYAGKEATVISISGRDREDCRMAQLSVEGVNVDQYKFRVRDLEFVNAQSSLEGDSRIISGAVVVIHKHRPVNGDTNWTSGMDRYVDRFAVVSDANSRDGAGCRIAHLVLEGETLSYAFRVRDLELVGSGPVESLGGDDNIKVGSSVIISKHRPVDGRENWASEMDRYVGCRAVVKEFTGTDSSRCKMARLTVDGTLISRFSFRVRDLTLISSAPQTSDPLSGSGEIRVGSRVVIHRHRPVCCCFVLFFFCGCWFHLFFLHHICMSAGWWQG